MDFLRRRTRGRGCSEGGKGDKCAILRMLGEGRSWGQGVGEGNAGEEDEDRSISFASIQKLTRRKCYLKLKW